MMEYQSRIAQGDYPTVINLLGVEISGRSEHILAKDVTLPPHELTQETNRRFETSSEFNLDLEMSHATARKHLQLTGKKDRALHRKPKRKIEAHVWASWCRIWKE